MKAIEYTQYGPPEVLQLTEIEKPSPKANEVRIQIHATTVNYGDLVARNFRHLTSADFNMPFIFWFMAKISFGLNKPNTRILGNEFAGVVEAAGKDIRRYKEGDPVFGFRGQSMGAYVEYLCMPEDGVLAPKPDNMSFEEAAAVPSGGMTALHILNQQGIRPGDRVLINGASGGIGSHALQIAKAHFGAEVTGVCSTPRLEYLKSLGADYVLDYTQDDFTKTDETYDLILDVLGRSTFSESRQVLKPGGRYVLVSFKSKQLLQMLGTSISGDQKVICALAPQGAEDLMALRELIEAGKIKSIVDRSYPLEQTAEAHKYAESGLKKGHVVIKVR